MIQPIFSRRIAQVGRIRKRGDGKYRPPVVKSKRATWRRMR